VSGEVEDITLKNRKETTKRKRNGISEESEMEQVKQSGGRTEQYNRKEKKE
jgi:hypothetical protein